jgi:hypothetical protein
VVAEVVAAEGAVTGPVLTVRPYAPSWVDTIMGWLDRAPGPTWLAYGALLAVGLGVAAIESLLSSAATIDPAQLFYGLFFVAPLAVLRYLDHVAGQVWDAFRPVTNLDDAAAARIRYELTVSPARAGWLMLALGYLIDIVWAVVDPGLGLYGEPAAYVTTRLVSEGLLGGILLTLVLQIVRQLQIVDRLQESATRIDLFQPRAVQAPSRLTARSAIGIVLIAVMLGLPSPNLPESTWLAALGLIVLPMLALALAAFFVPLRHLHHRLVEEQARLHSATAERLHATIAAFQQLVDSELIDHGDAERSRLAQARMDTLSKAQAALIAERDLISHLSTWPWNPTTLRAVTSAVALPVLIFLITRALEQLVF